ncbi:MAG: ATP-dependent DNA helicase RecQ [Bacteroidota bacterium]
MDSVREILKQYWGYDTFRPLQEDIILSVLEGNDTLALLPTGGGKSVCFQVPALAKDGICIVVSPLIALMKDQVENLNKRDIKAAAIYSGMSYRAINFTLDNCIHGDFKFLYVSPERLKTELFRERVKQMNVNQITVDEAHCISQWGYDFRPEYIQIAELRDLFPDVPMLALTASATPDVVNDIQEKLRFKKRNVFVKSFERANLSYVVHTTEDKIGRMLHILSRVKGSGLVYVRNRRKTQEIAQVLQNHHIRADFYHAGLANELRAKKQDEWVSNHTRIMVCTNAFGMGIDKPDVRVVVHYEMPESLESYYQEAGRAGRDEQRSYAVLLHNAADEQEATDRLELSYPAGEILLHVYRSLCHFYSVPTGASPDRSYDFDIAQFCEAFKLKPAETYATIKLLEQCDLVQLNESFFEASRLRILLHVDELYKFQVENQPFDAFIKLLLRSYGGLFDNYIVINEQVLAKRVKLTSQDVGRLLARLHMLGVVDYQPQKDKPQMTFLSQRLADDDFHRAMQFVKKRKKVAKEKMDAMLRYAANTLMCRSKLLVSYFDQYGARECGVCDVCIARKKLELTNERFEELITHILAEVSKQAVTVKELVALTPTFKQQNVTDAVGYLLDMDKLHYTIDQKLERSH